LTSDDTIGQGCARHRRHRDLFEVDELDFGLRLVVAD
jgi:hypothetical protein